MLKQLTFEEKRIKYLEGIKDSLQSFCFNQKYNYQYALDYFLSIGYIPSNNLDKFIEIKFGRSDDDYDLEYKIVEILALYYLIKQLISILKLESSYIDTIKVKGKILLLLKNTQIVLKDYAIEYKIDFDNKYNFIKYESLIKTKITIDNSKDIPKQIADPIAELLKPGKNEDELIGLISKVYMKFEKTKKNSLTNLNEADKSIYHGAWDLAKKIANNVKGAKGHEGTSQLTIKDIVYNFALNASLIQKLISLNNKKK